VTPDNRAAINRANARHSTGPKSAEGIQKSSLNALRHGLTSQIVVMPLEDLQAYREHLQRYFDEYHPKGATEADLVQGLADCSWRLNRVAAMETNLLTLGQVTPTGCPDAPPEIQQALSLVSALVSQSKALSTLSLHGQRLSRQFERTVTHLRELQKTRKAQEQHDLLEMHKDKGEISNASENGFVFSNAEIPAAKMTDQPGHSPSPLPSPDRSEGPSSVEASGNIDVFTAPQGPPSPRAAGR
jgi:hypothetical protein